MRNRLLWGFILLIILVSSTAYSNLEQIESTLGTHIVSMYKKQDTMFLITNEDGISGIWAKTHQEKQWKKVGYLPVFLYSPMHYSNNMWLTNSNGFFYVSKNNGQNWKNTEIKNSYMCKSGFVLSNDKNFVYGTFGNSSESIGRINSETFKIESLCAYGSALISGNDTFTVSGTFKLFSMFDSKIFTAAYGKYNQNATGYYIIETDTTFKTNVITKVPDTTITEYYRLELIQNNLYLLSNKGIFKKPLNGLTWQKISDGILNVKQSDDRVSCVSNIRLCNGLLQTTERLYTSYNWTDHFFYSNDYGVTWNEYPQPNNDVNCCLYTQDTIFMNIGDTIFYMNDIQKKWEVYECNISINSLKTIVAAQGNLAALNSNSKIIIANKSTKKWQQIQSPTANGIIKGIVLDGDNLLTNIDSSGSSTIYCTSIDLIQWEPVYTATDIFKISSLTNNVYIHLNNSGIVRLTRNMQRKYAVDTINKGYPKDTVSNYHPVIKLVESNGTLFALLYKKGIISLSNNSSSWKTVDTVSLDVKYAASLVVLDTMLFITKLNNLYKKSLSGTNWTIVSKELIFSNELGKDFYYENNNPSGLFMLGKSIYLSTDLGLKVSIDIGLTWNKMDENIIDPRIQFVAYDSSNAYIIEKTGGLFKFSTNSNRISSFPNMQSKQKFKNAKLFIYSNYQMHSSGLNLQTVYLLSGKRTATPSVKSKLPRGTYIIDFPKEKNAK